MHKRKPTYPAAQQDVLRLINRSLKSVNLTKNSICNAGASKIAFALEVNQTVKSLKLAHNDIGDGGVGDPDAHACARHAPVLRVRARLRNLAPPQWGI